MADEAKITENGVFNRWNFHSRNDNNPYNSFQSRHQVIININIYKCIVWIGNNKIFL